MAFTLNIAIPFRRMEISRTHIHGMIVQHVQYIDTRQATSGMTGISMKDILQNILPVQYRLLLKLICRHLNCVGRFPNLNNFLMLLLAQQPFCLRSSQRDARIRFYIHIASIPVDYLSAPLPGYQKYSMNHWSIPLRRYTLL